MKILLTLALFAFLLTSNSTFAQEPQIKIKKGIVYVDGTACLKTSVEGGTSTFRTMEGEEIIFIQYLDYPNSDNKYIKIKFIDQKLSLTSDYVFSRKKLIEKLISGKALIDCTLDQEGVETFVFKYNEDIPNTQQININVNN
jgi:hypothetical protein